VKNKPKHDGKAINKALKILQLGTKYKKIVPTIPNKENKIS
jgi:hypothetical protein